MNNRAASAEPVLVSNLDCKFSFGGKLFYVWRRRCEKIRLLWKSAAVEEWKLKDHRAKFVTEDIHCFGELSEFSVAVHQHFSV